MQSKSRQRVLQKSWLASYRDYIIRQESPDLFHFWVGITLIAAAMRRNVFVDRGAYRVYPNQYVFLIAKSGTCKKSAAMEIGLELIHKIDDIHTVHGRATVEGLIDTMNKASIDPSGMVKPDGSLLIHADELSYLFGKASYITDLLSFFTAAYTAKARLDFLTRGKGLAKVRNPCPTILAGTTPEGMGEVFPSMVLASGFMARCLLIYGIRGERVAKPILNKSMEDELIHDLGCIAQLCGEMKMTKEADEAFDKWYEEMPHTNDVDFESFYERKHDHVLKTATVLSVSESDEMKLTLDHFNMAVEAVDNIEVRRSDALANIGATTQSIITDQVLGYLRLQHPHPISHSVLLRKIYKRLTYGAVEFNSIIDTLKAQDRIEEIPGRKGVFYALRL